MSVQIFHDSEADRAFRPGWASRRVVIYGVLILWAFICLFPIYWTVTTSFKAAPDVMKGNLIPWVDFVPKWLGLRSLGLSPETIVAESTVRDEFLKRFWNSTIVSVGSSTIAVMLGSCAAYGLSRFSFRFGFMKNSDISFFFLSQLILPPVVLALPFLVLYKELALLDSRVGLIALYTLTVLPIVIWIMRDQFGSIPVELEEAAPCRWAFDLGRFPHHHPADCASRHGRGIHHLAGPDLERVFLCRSSDVISCQDPAGDGREPDRVSGNCLVVHGGAVAGRNPAAHRDRRGS